MLIPSSLNRRGETRQDQQRVDRWFILENTKILLALKGNYVCKNNKPTYFTYQQISQLGYDSEHLEKIYLGEDENCHYFVICISRLEQSLSDLQIIDLRTAALSTELFDISSLFYSQGLINWHFTHGFCAKCGSKTESSLAGHSRNCLNSECGKQHFPRIEPAVIFSIENSINDVPHLLLARQPSWPDKRYSVLAGFAEHGESLEIAVKREAMEEVGLQVSNIKYIHSQPWPFPASLMLGFQCETKQLEINLIDQELENADWYSAADIKTKLQSGELLMPFSVSISWHLIDRWYKKQTGHSLKTILKRTN
jgi:NAD+ diphosphatase